MSPLASPAISGPQLSRRFQRSAGSVPERSSSRGLRVIEKINTLAAPTISSSGPLTPLLLATGTGVVVWMWVRRRLPPLALVMASAAWLLVLTIALHCVLMRSGAGSSLSASRLRGRPGEFCFNRPLSLRSQRPSVAGDGASHYSGITRSGHCGLADLVSSPREAMSLKLRVAKRN